MEYQRTILIPAYNEAARLADGFARLEPVLTAFDGATEILIIDDGSTDGTVATVASVYGHVPGLRVVQQPRNLGKGAAVRLGWSLAKGDHVLVSDADMAIRPEYLPAIDAALDRVDFAPGTRALEGTIRYDSWQRTLAGGAFHRLVHHYTGTTFRDTQCGLKGLRLGVARLLGLMATIDGFAYDAEIFYLVERLGLSVEGVGVTWDDVSGSSVALGSHARSVLSDLRSIPRHRYVNPVIETDAAVSVQDVRRAAADVRQKGLVIVRTSMYALVVLPRDGALSAVSMAPTLKGRVRTATIDELRGGEILAV